MKNGAAGVCRCPLCGTTKSSRGRPLNRTTLEQHIHDAHEGRVMERLVYEVVDDDVPDGAYWALQWEIER